MANRSGSGNVVVGGLLVGSFIVGSIVGIVYLVKKKIIKEHFNLTTFISNINNY